MMSQGTEKTFSVEIVDLKSINTFVNLLRAKTSRGISHHYSNVRELRILVFSDSPCAKNADSSAQLGYIILLSDDTDRSNILHYCSYKDKLIVRSVFGGETYAFADAFDAGFMLLHDLQ